MVWKIGLWPVSADKRPRLSIFNLTGWEACLPCQARCLTSKAGSGPNLDRKFDQAEADMFAGWSDAL